MGTPRRAGPAMLIVPLAVIVGFLVATNGIHTVGGALSATTKQIQHVISPSSPPKRSDPSLAPPPPAVQEKILRSAHELVGEKLWAQTPWAGLTENGNLGCAASVSYVLQKAGVDVNGSAAVYGLRDQLIARGWDNIHIRDKSQFKPGDVVWGSNGYPDDHIGIIGAVDGDRVMVYANWSSTGQWTYATLEHDGNFVPGGRFGTDHLYVLRAPR